MNPIAAILGADAAADGRLRGIVNADAIAATARVLGLGWPLAVRKG